MTKIIKLTYVYVTKDLIKKIFENKISAPTVGDLIGSIVSIFKLEDTYLIEPIRFASENLSTNYVSLKLTGIYLQNFN